MVQNELEKTLGKVIDQRIMPELKEIKKKLQEHDGQFKSYDEKLDKIDKKLVTHDEKLEKIIKKQDVTFDAVGETKVEVTILQENISDQGFTLERMETKLDTTTHRQDDFSIKADQLNRRVLKLESKKA